MCLACACCLLHARVTTARLASSSHSCTPHHINQAMKRRGVDLDAPAPKKPAPLISEFDWISRDSRCQIMQYLYLNELMAARRVSKEWHRLPMQVCFKPDRLSAIPLNLLFTLTSKKLLPQTSLFKPDNRCFYLDEFPLKYEQFNLKHLASINSPIWDWADASYFYSVQECCLILCNKITEVIFYSDKEPILQRNSTEALRMFPNSSIWKLVFQGSKPPHPDLATGFIEDMSSSVKELIFLGHPAHWEAEPLRYEDILPETTKNLQVLRMPQFKLEGYCPDLHRHPALLYLEDSWYIFERKHLNERFIRTIKEGNRRSCVLCKNWKDVKWMNNYKDHRRRTGFLCTRCTRLCPDCGSHEKFTDLQKYHRCFECNIARKQNNNNSLVSK